MKAVRIIQVIILLAIIAYLALLYEMNQDAVIRLPFIAAPVYPVVLAIAALLAGWFLTWLFHGGRLFRLQRDKRRLQRQVSDLERQLRRYRPTEEPGAPIIPDRDTQRPKTIRPSASDTEHA